MEKDIIRANFGKELKKVRKTLFPNYNQERFADKINSNLPPDTDFYLDQKKVSLLETGKNITVSKSFITILNDLCSTWGCQLDDEIVESFKALMPKTRKFQNKTLIKITEYENILSKPYQKIFSNYFGQYNCIFHSTDSSDPKCIKGIMAIKRDDIENQCKVSFEIVEDKNIIKTYEGPFFFNTYYNMWYCILIEKKLQEICMITAKHFNSSVRENLFNVALVITTSAGQKKRPTMHRMFITRKEINDTQENLILSQLKLNDDTIVISEKDLNVLKESAYEKLNNCNNIDEKFLYEIVIKCIKKIEEQPCEKIYRIDESILYDTKTISTNKTVLGLAVSKIRGYTDNKYYNKLSDTVHEICTDIMEREI